MAAQNLRDTANEVEAAVRDILISEAENAVSEIRSQWPRRTGESAAGWEVRSTSTGAVIANDVDYAGYVQGGQAIVSAALQDADMAIKTRVNETIMRLLTGRG